MSISSNLEGKVALVTGGSRGIGAAIAFQLARNGADVALTYMNSVESAQRVVAGIQAAGRRGLAIPADNSDSAAVESAVSRTAREFGRIDILVNSAGILVTGPLESLTLDDFDRIVRINVRAAFVAAKSAAAYMVNGGRIISIGSNLAERASGPGFTLYSLSKAALTGLTKGLAHDLGPHGVTVNIVQPGSTDTDMNPASGPFADRQRSRMAIPRFAEPEEVASLVVWLAGSEARSVTGASLTIDGGANA